MSDGKVSVQERATGQIFRVWPIDARALLASGEYDPVDEGASSIAGGKPVHPLGKKHPQDAQSVKEEHEKEVAALHARSGGAAGSVAGDAGASSAGDDAPTTAPGSESEPSSQAPESVKTKPVTKAKKAKA